MLVLKVSIISQVTLVYAEQSPRVLQDKKQSKVGRRGLAVLVCLAPAPPGPGLAMCSQPRCLGHAENLKRRTEDFALLKTGRTRTGTKVLQILLGTTVMLARIGPSNGQSGGGLCTLQRQNASTLQVAFLLPTFP